MLQIGELVYGDTGTSLVLSLKRSTDGSAVDLTGAGSISYSWRTVVPGEKGTLAAAVNGSPVNGQLTAQGIGNLVDPGSRPYVDLEVRATWTIAGKVYWQIDAVRVRLVKFP